MPTAADQVADIIFGRWRSQVLYAGTELGIFDHLEKTKAKTAETLAAELGADPTLLYRLLRAESAIGLLEEDDARGFALTEMGALLRSDHPQSLKAVARLAEGPQHYAIWKHLPAMVREGKQNGFLREFARGAFEHTRHDADYAERFNDAMSNYSVAQSALVLEALRNLDFSGFRTLCDVAGGQGYLMCALLHAYPHTSGIVLDLPAVVNERDKRWASKLGLEDRCRYVGGDMFKEVPSADAYILKLILHDWNDDECIEILSNIREAATGRAHVFIAEHVVSGPNIAHFSKLYDIHMMCWGSGQERTEAEYLRLLEKAGWRPAGSYYPDNRLMGVVDGICS
jgi:O-methyltransferase domain/Dimerisation domain